MKNSSTLNKEVVNSLNRSFYLNVKQTEKGNNYLVITQAQKDSDGVMDRRSIVLFEHEVAPFAAAMMKSLLMFNPIKKGKQPTNKTPKAAVQKTHSNVFKKWSKAEDVLLTEFFKKGATIEELTITLQRNKGGVLARLKKLELMSEKELEYLVSESK